MPYEYKHSHETMEDIKKEYSDPYRHAPTIPGTSWEARLKREQAIRDRAAYLEALDYRDATRPVVITLSVNIKNPYEIKSAIDTLLGAYETAMKTKTQVPDLLISDFE